MRNREAEEHREHRARRRAGSDAEDEPAKASEAVESSEEEVGLSFLQLNTYCRSGSHLHRSDISVGVGFFSERGRREGRERVRLQAPCEG